jgi:hypothetical protein
MPVSIFPPTNNYTLIYLVHPMLCCPYITPPYTPSNVMMLEKRRTLSEVIENLRGELGAPSPHHGVDLKGFISRGQESDQKIRQFYRKNSKIQQQEYKRYSSGASRIVISKQDYGFLHIINGSGLGKTWMGQYTCKYIQNRLDRHSVMCLLDFANGNKYLFIA